MDSNVLDKWCQTPFWDSNLTWYTNNPDFTQCFQTTVLVWVPCSILWLNFFAELFRVSKWKIQRSFSWSKLRVIKMVLLLGLTMTSLVKLAYEIYFGRGGSLFYFSQAYMTGTYLLAMVLLLYERGSTFSTGMQFLFWLISAVAGTITYRSFLMRMNSKFLFDDFVRSLALETSLYSLTILMFVLSFVADNRLSDSSDGNKNLEGNQMHFSPEDTASLPSRILHSWLTGTIWKAWKNHTTTTDVFEMSLSDRTLARSKIFEKYWSFQNPNKSSKSESEQDAFLRESKESSSRSQHKSMIPALLKTIRSNLIVGIITQIFTDLISFTSPVILRWLLEFASNDEPLWKGIFYAFLIAVAGVLQSLFIEATALSFNKMVVYLKSITIYAMYKKTLRMSNSERNRLTIGKILNTMYVDTERFSKMSMHIGIMITGPINIIFGFYLIYRELGVAALAGLFAAVASVPITLWITKVRTLKEVEYKRIEDLRIKMTNEILSGVRVLKLYAWESSFENIVNEIRKREIVFKRSWGLLVAALSISWYTTPILVALLTFSTYVLIDENNIMTTAAAFVTLQIITIMIDPINKISVAIFYFSSLKISINRMSSILNSDEMEEYVQSGNNNEQFDIQMQDCTFRWGNELEPTLSNINISVPKGSLIAIVGPIGCGKSSLLSSLVCEMLKDNGQAYVTGSMGYMTQQPWIQNTSFRENILFTAPMDEIWYREVIEACALEFDLVNLPGYDETEIGERGINLSGGQKQRVSLARAVYRLYDIYLLDDPLGAVDSHVAKHIFDKVIGPNGLLKNKTRLLVTHNVSFLRDVDEIYFMQNGNIIEKGSFERIMSNKGIAGNYLTQHMKEENHDEVDEDSCLPKVNLEKRSNNNLTKKCLIQSEERNTDSKNAKLITKENLKKGSASWAVYGRYFSEVGSLWSVFCLISCVCFQALTVYSSYWLILWSQDFKPDNDGTMAETNFRLWIYSLISLGQILLLSLTFVAIFVGCLNASNALHFKMLRSILRSPMSFFDTTPIGRIINRFSQDLNTLDTTMCINVKNCLILLVSTFAFLIATIVAIPFFIFPIIIVVIVFAIIQHILLFTNGQLRRSKLTRDSFLYAHISGALAGTTVIRVCGLAENFQAQFRKLLDDRNSTNYLRIIAQRWLNVRINILGNFLLFCTALFSVFGKGKISPGIVGFVMTNSTVLIENAKTIIQRTTDLGTYILSAERVQEYCELKSEAEWEKPEVNLPPDWPQRGQIIFRNYSSKYREGLDLVLKDINLKIEGGEKVGVVGRTGAGKSSLTLALFRLIEGVSGEIVVDGVDIGQLGLREARSRLTIIPQEPVLLSGTLRLNLDPFQAHPDHLLHSALQHAHLDAFLQSLPEGLDHPISEGGQNLSVGQRQLVCLARALLRETRILILDEATASVDLDTDDLIQATIRKEFASSTVITIAHRISTIMDYDKVIVLDQGRVVEFDSPKNLLNNNQSSFYSLVKDANCI